MRQDHILLLLVLVLFSQSENPRNPWKEEEKAKEAGREEELVVTTSLLPCVSQLSNMKI